MPNLQVRDIDAQLYNWEPLKTSVFRGLPKFQKMH